MTVSRVLRITAAVVCFVWVLVYPTPAEASCVSPSVTADHTSVARGDVIEIRGFYFGTACNDEGQGGPVLGKPQASISLQIVQGAIAIPIAVVDAASNYRFVVRVTIPAELDIGPAMVTASSIGLGEVTDAIVITESAIPAGVSAPPTFVLGRDSTAPRVDPPGSSSTRWIVAGGLVALVVAAIVGVIQFRRRRNRPYEWIQEPKSLS